MPEAALGFLHAAGRVGVRAGGLVYHERGSKNALRVVLPVGGGVCSFAIEKGNH